MKWFVSGSVVVVAEQYKIVQTARVPPPAPKFLTQADGFFKFHGVRSTLRFTDPFPVNNTFNY
jgi:hypothetical protein